MPPQTQERPATWAEIIAGLAEEAGVPGPLALAVAQRESGLDPTKKGALDELGIMQLRPATATEMGVDITDPLDNVRGGILYLKQLTERYDGDVQKVLMAYNGGPTAVDAGTPSAAAQAYAEAILSSLGGGPAEPPSPPPPQDPPIDPVSAHDEEAKRYPWYDPRAYNPLGSIQAASVTAAREGSLQAGAREILPATGAIVGAVKGGIIGAPAGPLGIVAGAVTGAGVGAFATEGVLQGLEYLGGVFGFTEPTEQTPRSMAAEMGSAANTAMFAEVLGRGTVNVLTPVATRFMAPFKSKVSTYAREALEEFPPDSRTLLPAELSESRFLSVASNIAEGSLLGGGRITGTVARRLARAQERVAEIAGSVGRPVSTHQAGAAIAPARQARIEMFRRAERRVWGAFDDAAEGIEVPTPLLDDFIETLTQQQKGTILPNAGATAARRVAQLTGSVDDLTMAGGSPSAFALMPASVQEALLEQAGGGVAAKITVAVQFRRTVSDLGKLVRSLEKSAQTDPSKYNAQLGLAKRIYGLARQDLTNALEAAGGAYTPVTRIVRGSNPLASSSTDTWFAVGHLDAKSAAALNDMYTGGTGRVVKGYVPTRSITNLSAKATDELGNRIVTMPSSEIGLFKTTAPPSGASGAARAYERATAVTRAGNVRLFDTEVIKLAEKAPEQIAQTLMKTNNSTTIRAIEKAVGPRAMQGIRRASLDSMVTIDQKANTINWAAFATKLNSMGDDTLGAMFPKGHAAALKKYARLMLDIEGRPETGVGRVGIMLTQWGAVAGVATGNFTRAGLGILFIPSIMSKVMASPAGLKWLTIGLQAPAGSAQAVKAAVMLTAFLRQQDQPVASHDQDGGASQ